MTKSNTQAFHLLIPAAGNASRMSMETPKPYLRINGKTILEHTAEKFIKFSNLKCFSIVIHEDHKALYDTAFNNIKPPATTIGSNNRKQSVYNGLQSLIKVKKDDIILIHDAARPLVSKQDITAILDVMKTADAATLATPVTDTLQRNDESVSRDGLWAIQTPQAFRYGKLIEAHEKFKDDDSFTDDAGLMRAMGHKVEIVPASRQNIKITTSEDFDMVQAMINTQKETRTTMGFDVHAFEEQASARKLMLGGIEIPHDLALAGHSDADVVLHAITDALLGSINQGDIGTHFPPSDPQWKDVDSVVFLKKAKDLLDDNSVDIKFIDVTLMAEEPKIGPHREAMQKRIADILGLEPNRISIKATTTEKLGFTGRKEGMACQALATVLLPE
jgi:2-C-methyl-D-erythritol 4-phosphate cytidylyltransferase/2-C-methyl-D-erythritol 2,4-cyclodiphosphate synthase